MQLNLTALTHLLELQTSVVGSIHYQVGYSNVTNTTATAPISAEGIITTATTTVIVTGSSGTTTKIQYLNVYNNGDSNIITIKKDVGGTEYIYQKIGLQKGESFRIVNDKVEVFDISGRVKLQNMGDTEISGDSRVIFKVGTAIEAAGQYYCFAKDSGAPGAWTPGTPGINGRNTDGTTAADLGCISAGIPAIGSNYVRDMVVTSSQPGTFIMADILWVNTGIAPATLTPQLITQPVLPLRDNLGTSNGFGIGAGILVTTATTNAGVIANITISYTNSTGTAGKIGTMTAFPATAVVGTFVPFQLAAGDVGIRSIQSITIGTTLGAGAAISLIAFNFLGTVPVVIGNVGSIAFQKKLDLKLNNGHCLIPFWLASSATAINITGTVYFVNK